MSMHRILLLALAGLGFMAASAAAPAPSGPNPDLDPAQTVQAMLAALKKNSDAGIAELFRFSSPRNAEAVGPLPRFTQLIRESFGDLLGHRSSKLMPAIVDGPRAKIAVEVEGSDRALHHYGFMLSQQDVPGCEGCWMADAVVSLDEPEDEGPGGRPGLQPT